MTKLVEAARYVLVDPTSGFFYAGAGAAAPFVFCSARGEAQELTLPEARAVIADYERAEQGALALRPA